MARAWVAGALAVAGLLGSMTSHAYTNPATAIVGAIPTDVIARAPTIVATQMGNMTPTQWAALGDNSQVAIWTIASGAAWTMAGRVAGGQARLSAAVNARVQGGTVVSTWAPRRTVYHFVCRQSCANGVTQQMYDVFNALYAETLTGESNAIPPASREKAAWEQVIIIITTGTRVGAVDILSAAGTGWWLGYDVVGPLALWGLQTYAPGTYDAIGNGIGAVIESFTYQAAISFQSIVEIDNFEMQLQSYVALPTYDFYMPDGSIGYDGSMDVMDFDVCDPINTC